MVMILTNNFKLLFFIYHCLLRFTKYGVPFDMQCFWSKVHYMYWHSGKAFFYSKAI